MVEPDPINFVRRGDPHTHKSEVDREGIYKLIFTEKNEGKPTRNVTMVDWLIL